MQIARAALVLCETWSRTPRSRSGRAVRLSWRGFRSARLMDSLPALMQGQQAGYHTDRRDTRRLLPRPLRRWGLRRGWRWLFAETGGAGPERPRSVGGQVSPLGGTRAGVGAADVAARGNAYTNGVARAALVVGGPGNRQGRGWRGVYLPGGRDAWQHHPLHRNPGSFPKQIFALLAPVLTAVGYSDRGTRAGPGQARVRAVVARHVLRAVLPSWCWRTCSGRMRPALQVMDEVLGLLSEFSHCWFWPWVGPRVERTLSRPVGERNGSSNIRLGTPATQGWAVSVPPAGNPPLAARWSSTSCSSAGKQSHVPGRDGGRRRGGPFGSAGRSCWPRSKARFDCLSPEVRRVLRATSLYGDKFFHSRGLGPGLLGEASRGRAAVTEE